MSWKPNWLLPPAPCAHPDTCSPQQPTCLPCSKGKQMYETAIGGAWDELKEWQREAWRREAADAKDW